jgi:protease secretion system outer membrane protein
VALAEVQVIDAQDALDAAQRALQALTGAPAAELQRLDALPPDFAAAVAPGLQTPGFEHWQAQALAGNAELAAQRQSLEASRQEVRRQEAGHWPTLRAFAQHSRNESEIAATYNQRYRTNTVGLVLNVPLYGGGGVSASSRQAAYQYDSARHALDAKTDEVLLDLRRQHRLSDSGPARIAAGLQAVRAAEAALEGNRRGVAAGDRINLDVLNAEQQLFSARRDLARAVYDTVNARLALRWRAGSLGEDDLREVAGYFVPAPASSAGTRAAGTALLSSQRGTEQ